MAERICLLMIGDVYTTSCDNLHVYVTQTTIQLNSNAVILIVKTLNKQICYQNSYTNTLQISEQWITEIVVYFTLNVNCLNIKSEYEYTFSWKNNDKAYHH